MNQIPANGIVTRVLLMTNATISCISRSCLGTIRPRQAVIWSISLRVCWRPILPLFFFFFFWNALRLRPPLWRKGIAHSLLLEA
jgi:hypothetical protein